MRDGDIFHWSYKDKSKDYLAYWCKSRICVANGGRLRDTYWGSGGDNLSFSFEDAEKLLDLEFVANEADLERKPEYMAEYYADADIVNLNHPNSTKGNFYLRKGAKRSAEKMLEIARYQKQKAESESRYAAERAVRLRETIDRIEAGEPLDQIHL